ncbi:MAG: enoyl-CoA hydratase/isomerase family protein [Candidatus Lokiarchaeota archaeon]|nr:enoyl-CoA hydratase/isomerase family protein [Candidatus Lokiarchaeota archaeon]
MIIQTDFDNIYFKIENSIGKITLNRPKRLNALNYPMLLEIINVLESNSKNKLIRAFSIEGNSQSFSSGDDLKSMGPEGVKFKPLEDGSKLPHHKVIRLIREIQKPFIALLQGYCLGAGFELALACDFRIAADNLKVGDQRVNRAHCVMSGASWLLPRLIGFARATDIILTGRLLDAKEALSIGLINKVFSLSEFSTKSEEFTQSIASLPTKCLGYNKNMLNYSQYNELFPSLIHEFKLYCKNIASYDFGEGMKSFKQKREPKFKGK